MGTNLPLLSLTWSRPQYKPISIIFSDQLALDTNNLRNTWCSYEPPTHKYKVCHLFTWSCYFLMLPLNWQPSKHCSRAGVVKLISQGLLGDWHIVVAGGAFRFEMMKCSRCGAKNKPLLIMLTNQNRLHCSAFSFDSLLMLLFAAGLVKWAWLSSKFTPLKCFNILTCHCRHRHE